MDFSKLLSIVDSMPMMAQSSAEIGLIYALTVLSLFLSYSMLNVCDLSTDGCWVFGGAVGAVVAISGHPWLSIPASMLAGMLSGFVTAVLQTRMGVNSLLAGIVVNTALYSVNISVMGKAQLAMNKTETVFTLMKQALKDTPFAGMYNLAVGLIAVTLVILFLSFFLRTRLGLAIRATGNNPDMVRTSSINPKNTTLVGLCISNAFTGLSGCLFAQYQKSLDINAGSGILTVALASLLIGGVFFGVRRSIPLRAVGAVIGAFIFRMVYAIALRLDMPSHMLRAVSSIIVVLTISIPYLRKQWPLLRRRLQKGGRSHA